MYAFMTIIMSLAALIALLRLKVKVGLAMVISACILAVLLGVWPWDAGRALIEEWRTESLTNTTGYLFVSLTALVLLVNVIGAAMEEIGISKQLVPAMHGLFRSRRFALAMIPMLMGMLPTPGGIMLSAPMVREAGDKIGVERSRLAAINFLFRHQMEPVWPLYPVIPLVQSLLGVSALTVFSYHIILTVAAIVCGIVVLLLFGIPPKQPEHRQPEHRMSHSLRYFLHAFWPIALTAGLYVIFDVPPAVGIFIAIIGLLVMHKVPFNRWADVFKAAREPDMVLLIFGALFFKLNLEAGEAIGSVVQFLTSAHVPIPVLLFLLPMLVGFATGVTMPTVAITYPFLLAFIGTGADVNMGLESLAFAGVLFGLWLTPVHLCIALSAGYFQTSLIKIISKLFLPTAGMAAAAILLALFLS
jgi:integral membrane protein (TIGR00529 family)